MTKIPLSELKKDRQITATLLGEHIRFNTTWGLFCPEEIDSGTKLLLDTIKDHRTILSKHLGSGTVKDVLDIGCGYGPIGLSIAKSNPHTHVDLIDKDFVAVEYSEKNKLLNDIKNAHVFLSNGLSHVPEQKKYDLILSNLPAKVSKEFFWILFAEILEHLRKDGICAVVVIRQLEIMVCKNFNTLFGNFEVVDRDKTYSIIITRKN